MPRPPETRRLPARTAAIAALSAVLWSFAPPSLAESGAVSRAPGVAEGQRTILFLGDSLTEGFGVEIEQSYPALVEQRLRGEGREVRVINAGISGSTSASAVSRLEWQLRAPPDVVVLALGANDGLRGVAVAETRANLDRAIGLALEHGVQVLLAGMKLPPNYGADYTREFEAIFPALAEKWKVALIPFLLEGVAARPELNLPDGIHPNPEGYRIVTETVLAHLVPLL